ncbi:MAG: hypothetical protein Q4D62_06635 [Planctomycetia bacterium]|nr:hypothetical protein [Planctomycetia bacterium]
MGKGRVRKFQRKIIGIFLGIVLLWGGNATGTEIQMKDGRILSGSEGILSTLGEIPTYAQIDSQTVSMNIVFLDDGLRRTYFSHRQAAQVLSGDTLESVPERFTIRQRIKEKGPSVQGVGTLLRVEPFDDFGRRTITMQTTKGPLALVQCITELTPKWVKVECTNYQWDMRLATSSIPREQLLPILRKQAIRLCKGDEVEAAKKIARFFIQGEQYEEAAREIHRMIQVSENQEDVRKELATTLVMARQLSAKTLLQELVMRRKNGQYQMVREYLAKFPEDGVAGETLQEVRAILEEDQKDAGRIQNCLEAIQKLWQQLEDQEIRETLRPVLVEILENINENTISRMEAWEDMLDVDGVGVYEKTALAVTCWLMGSRHASDRIVTATSAVRVRELIQQYLESGSELGREAIFQRFQSEEAANIRTVWALLSHMKPPIPLSKKEWLGKDGFFKIQVISSAVKQPVDYWVQLPLEYDPHRLYPAVLCVPGIGEEPTREVDWWCGDFTPKGIRMGQGGRQGYIVIVPDWTVEGQREYEFSLREQDAVLSTLHDACQRFSVDPDRVFLSGRFTGGDAAWDIGLAHPDLWAGVILFSCEARKYCMRYWPNAKRLPFYFVCGELDNQLLGANAGNLNRYFTGGYDLTIVEYLGRGREDFQEEIHSLFDWMNRRRREFYPDAFAVRTMRPWDNFFWWLEVERLPAKANVPPARYPVKGSVTAKISGEFLPKANTLRIESQTGIVRVWIGPKMLDFDQKINILVNGKNVVDSRTSLKPDLRTLLEDVRRRGDRQNPFWCMLEVDTGRARGN